MMLTRVIAWSTVLFLVGCEGAAASPPDDAAATGVDASASAADAGEDSGLPADPMLARWESVPAPDVGPLAIWGFLAADLGDGRALVFGGTNASEASGTTLGRAWLYDMRGSELAVSEVVVDGTKPAPRYCGCAAWDPERGKLVMTGGRDLDAPLGVPPETWELDLATSTWTEVAVPSSPQGVIGCSMAWSGARHAMYLFGGAGARGASSKIFRYDATTPEWVELPATGPVPRYDAVLQPRDDGAKLLMFAGSLSASGAAFYSDLWLFDTTSETWVELEIAGDVPEGRRTPWVAQTPDGRGMYVAMGYDGDMLPIDDFWWLDFESARWTRLELGADGPRARGFSPALPGAALGLGIMLGGFDAHVPVRDVWRLVAP